MVERKVVEDQRERRTRGPGAKAGGRPGRLELRAPRPARRKVRDGVASA